MWKQKNAWAKPAVEKWFEVGDEWLMSSALPETAAGIIAAGEQEWDAEKVEQKIKEYFNKGARGLEFKGRVDLKDCVTRYIDSVMASIFASLGDREWLLSGQVDFLLLIDAAIKDKFPSRLLNSVSQADFEQMVLMAYEHAFEENRFGPILSEAVPLHVSGPKIKKKVWNSLEGGRKEAVQNLIDNVDDFTRCWIDRSIALLSEASQGSPEFTMEQEVCCKLFTHLLENHGLPLSLSQSEVAPLHLVDEAVQTAYAAYTVVEEWTGPSKKKRKTGGAAAWGAQNQGMEAMTMPNAFNAWTW